MAGERASEGVAAGAATGAGVPGLLGLLLAMEAGVPIPVPSDLVMLLLGERVSAGALPLWLAAAALELVALAGTAALFLAARAQARPCCSGSAPAWASPARASTASAPASASPAQGRTPPTPSRALPTRRRAPPTPSRAGSPGGGA